MANDNSDNQRKITPQELADHATAKDCWLLIDGVVYDVTKFLDNHPGGSAVMVEHAGQDCSSNFEDIGHSSYARAVMKTLQVGVFAIPGKQGLDDATHAQPDTQDTSSSDQPQQKSGWLRSAMSWTASAVTVGVQKAGAVTVKAAELAIKGSQKTVELASRGTEKGKELFSAGKDKAKKLSAETKEKAVIYAQYSKEKAGQIKAAGGGFVSSAASSLASGRVRFNQTLKRASEMVAPHSDAHKAEILSINDNARQIPLATPVYLKALCDNWITLWQENKTIESSSWRQIFCSSEAIKCLTFRILNDCAAAKSTCPSAVKLVTGSLHSDETHAHGILSSAMEAAQSLKGSRIGSQLCEIMSSACLHCSESSELKLSIERLRLEQSHYECIVQKLQDLPRIDEHGKLNPSASSPALSEDDVLTERLLQSAQLIDSQNRILSLIDCVQKILQTTGVSASELEQFVSQIVLQRDDIEQDLTKVRLKQEEVSSQISDADAALLQHHDSSRLELVAAQEHRDGIKKRIEELEAQLAQARGELADSESHLAAVRRAGESTKKQHLQQQDSLQKQLNALVADASQDECELRGTQSIEALLKSLSLEISVAHNRIVTEMEQSHSRCKDDHLSAMSIHCRHLVSSTSVMRRQLEFLNSEVADLDAKASKLQELGMVKELKSVPSQKQRLAASMDELKQRLDAVQEDLNCIRSAVSSISTIPHELSHSMVDLDMALGELRGMVPGWHELPSSAMKDEDAVAQTESQSNVPFLGFRDDEDSGDPDHNDDSHQDTKVDDGEDSMHEVVLASESEAKAP